MKPAHSESRVWLSVFNPSLDAFIPQYPCLECPKKTGELVSKFVSLKQASGGKRGCSSSPKDLKSSDRFPLHSKVVLTFKSSSFLWCPQSKATQSTMLQDSNIAWEGSISSAELSFNKREGKQVFVGSPFLSFFFFTPRNKRPFNSLFLFPLH